MTKPGLRPEQLELLYEELAVAIDTAGPKNEAVFLARLALTLGHRLGDLAAFREAVAIALEEPPVL